MSSPAEQNPTSFLRQIIAVLFWGLIVATFFMVMIPGRQIANTLGSKLSGQQAFEPPQPELFPTPTSRPRPRIGVVAGHWGNDSGAVCSDELSEAEVNLTIATMVKDQLVIEGFDVDLLKEFDPLLSGYRALALVSIHADSCDYINDQATGFKVASALGSANQGQADRLSGCIQSRYGTRTGLSYHGTSITPDMTSYHAFDEVHVDTPAVIIETGFLNLDRQILTNYPDVVARGITEGILCFIQNQDIN